MDTSKREAQFALSGLALILITVLVVYHRISTALFATIFIGILAANGVFEYQRIQTAKKRNNE